MLARTDYVPGGTSTTLWSLITPGPGTISPQRPDGDQLPIDEKSRLDPSARRGGGRRRGGGGRHPLGLKSFTDLAAAAWSNSCFAALRHADDS